MTDPTPLRSPERTREIAELIKHLNRSGLDDVERLKGGGDGPYDPGMEKRIESLETDAREVRKDLTDIKVILTRIETELGHKISYKWLTIYVLGLAALILRSEIATLFSGGPTP